MNYALSFKINNRRFNFDVTSKSFLRGKGICQLQNPVYKNKELLENGYILESFPIKWYTNINRSITSIFSQMLGNPKGFTLQDYHHFVDDGLHEKTMNSFRAGYLGVGGVHLNNLGIDYKEFDQWINKIVQGDNLSCVYKKISGLVSVKRFWVRVIRPNSSDNNPPHKDTHVKRIKDNVNIYLPLAGSNKNSSLPLIPKTHTELESEYIISDSPCYVKNKKFIVPAVVHRNKGLDLITPNPERNEIMIFDPHCIHGGGINSNKDTTRVSLEMRFFKS
jgi:hypothetical protein